MVNLPKKTIVISQPMYFPWLGIFEQIKLADIFVFYDDVQLSRGFYNRVQLKTPNGIALMTVPIANKKREQCINQSIISYDHNWVKKHRATLISSYKGLKYIDDAVSIFDLVHENHFELLSQIGINSILQIANYIGVSKNVEFQYSSEYVFEGNSTERLINICRYFNGTNYVTGHGALNYLDHNSFETNNITVEYMKYDFIKYYQAHGAFTPFVSALDAIAHLGPDVLNIMRSSLSHWSIATKDPKLLLPHN